MIRDWIRGHRQLVTTWTGGTVVVALLTGFALVSSGYDAQRVDLDDGSVWVVNSAQQAVGRANTSVLELDTVVDSRSEDIDVLQAGSTVLLVDRGSSRLDVIDDATSAVVDTAPIPAGAQVMLAGTRVAILVPATGDLWLVPIAGLSAFDAATPPTLTLGADAVGAMDEAGTLLVYSADAGTLSRIRAATDDTVEETVDVGPVGTAASGDAAPAGSGAGADPAADTVQAGAPGRPAAARLALTGVAGHWAIYDADSRALLVDGRAVDLAGSVAPDARVALQRASARGSGVLVAHTGGLVDVPVAGGDPVAVSEQPRGDPARPVRIDGCEFAGWADGSSWQRCRAPAAIADEQPGDARRGDAGAATALAGMPAQATLRFLVDGARVVLNDVRGGAAWAVQRGAGLIDNWSDLIDRERSDTVVEENTADTPPEIERVQQPPVAVDDELGARPGRTTALPVLLNDHDPNGDVLLIDSVTPVDQADGTVDIVDQGQGLQLALAAGASGSVRLAYTVSDGRGGTATAQVRVTVRDADENSAPVEARPATGTVAEGGRLATDVLGGWYDPDGDPLLLARASTAAPDTVSAKPDGGVVFTDGGAGGDARTVALQVSDGRAEGSGALVVTVRRAGDVPLVAEGFVVQAAAGREVTVDPLAHARGGSGVIRLAAVPARPGVQITPDLEAGTFRLQGVQTGTHLLEYTVTDGQVTATGIVRVEIRGAASDGKPVTVPHTVFVRTLGVQDVDVLAADFDPAGGVLVITDATSPGDAAGVRAEVVGQRLVRITLTRPLDRPLDVAYRVSNGVAESTGTITVIEVPDPAVRQPPVATDDRVAVRVGDAVDIPVLANDEQPDGDALRLDPELVDPLPAGAGLLFAADDELRYLAPEQTGDYTAVYRVIAPDGQWATATLTIQVREADVATNTAPVPRPLTARVLAGETVRIPVPLTGIDPDGDSVRLLGQDMGPGKGQVAEVGAGFIDYRAGDYSTGTDTFAYAVVDGLGARATGTVRVGISPRVEGARNPVATADEVTVRPGRTLRVQVLANDTDPDGGTLELTSVQPQTADVLADLDGDVVRVVAPEEAGRYGLVYGVRNARGGTDEAFLTVVVDPAAPATRPLARDTVLQLSDVLDRTSVDVDVMRNVFSAEGDVSALVLSVAPGFEDVARVLPDGRIRVDVGGTQRIVPFTVALPDDAGVRATAFVWVPGYEDTLPQLRAGAERPTVASGERLVVDLDRQVVAAGGRAVRIADPNSVSATHADGAVELVDDDTLAFTSAAGYFGPAAIAFTVTDAAGDGEGRTAALVLPVTVTPSDNQPPVFTGAVIDLEPGQSKDIDLGRLTTYPYEDDRAQLAFALEGAVAAGFQATVDGSTLRISAAEGVATGATASFPVSVRDATQAGGAGRVDLRIVPSTRPLAQPATDEGTVTRGSSTSVDVLANDQAGNPFPGSPLTVAAIRGADGQSLPAGVTVTPSADRGTLAVTASADAEAGDVRVQYEVRDATGDAGRAAFGTVIVHVQDRPGPVSALRASGFGDRALTVAFEPGLFHNSPITGYQVRVLQAGVVTATVLCPSTTCTVPTPGNGPGAAVAVEVQAVNAVGSSDTVAVSGLWSDVVPAAPAGLSAEPLVDGLRVSWQPAEVAGSASPVTQYVVTVGGITRQVPAGTTSVEVRDPSLVAELPVAYRVAARNSAQVVDASAWISAASTGTPRGAPTATGTPTAVADAGDETSVTVSWPAFQGPGVDGIRYLVAAYRPGSAPGCRVATEGVAPWSAEHGSAVDVGGATSHVFAGLATDQPIAFAVLAANSQGCTVVEAGQLTPRTAPSTPAVTVSTPQADRGSDGVFRAVLADARYRAGSADASAQLLYRVDGQGDGVPIAVGQELTLPRTGAGASIQVRVVEDHGDGRPRSSGWSAPVDAGTAVDARAGDVRFGAPDGSGAAAVSWTSMPQAAGDAAAGGYARTEYRCGGEGAWTDASAGAAGSCALAPGADRVLEVRVAVDSGTLYTYGHRG